MFDPIILFSFPGGMEWVLIFLAVLLLFGGRKIPELMRGLGKGIREFNDAKGKIRDEIEDGMGSDDEKESKTSHKSTPKSQKSKESPESASQKQ